MPSAAHSGPNALQYGRVMGATPSMNPFQAGMANLSRALLLAPQTAKHATTGAADFIQKMNETVKPIVDLVGSTAQLAENIGYMANALPGDQSGTTRYLIEPARTVQGYIDTGTSLAEDTERALREADIPAGAEILIRGRGEYLRSIGDPQIDDVKRTSSTAGTQRRSGEGQPTDAQRRKKLRNRYKRVR